MLGFEEYREVATREVILLCFLASDFGIER